MPQIKIFLLGQFDVLIDGHRIQSHLWQSRQVRSILKILVAMRGKPVTSSQILDIIWHDEDPEASQKRLYVRISQLRSLFENEQIHDLIQKVDGGYLFSPDTQQDLDSEDSCISIDVEEFEIAADRGRSLLENTRIQEAIEFLEKGRDLYCGEYLAEDLYEEWTIRDRERLRERFLTLLTELAEAYAQMGYYRRAINICHQVLTIEPYRETIFARLMLYYYYSGDKAKALQVYENCQRVLFEELDVTPGLGTKNLAIRIKEGNLWTTGSFTRYPPPVYEGRLFEVPFSLGEPPFLGREREYAWLVQQWHRNPLAVLWIEGEAGIGKTRLAEEFTGYITKEGVQVFRLRGLNNINAPYAAWIYALENYSGISQGKEFGLQTKNDLVAILNELREISTTDFTQGSFQNTKQHETFLRDFLLKSVSQNDLLWVDDAHLLDTASIQLMSELAGKIPMLITCRSEEMPSGHPLRLIATDVPDQLAELHLKPLGEEGIKSILDFLGAVAMPQLHKRLIALTQGNPFYLIATLQHLFEEGILFVNSIGEWEQSGPFEKGLSPTIQETISSRLRTLKAENHRILDVIAVAGNMIDYDILQGALKVDETRLLNGVDELIENGFLIEPRIQGKAEVFLSHAYYGEVLYQTLPSARKRIYHRLLGDTMVKMGKDSALITGFSRATLTWEGNQKKPFTMPGSLEIIR